ncbi:putative Secretin receptor [Hypsibius exemplaris]|uniref:Secretin receptor n=1 Tax=Hypsibius exemplaris TaxID=2072580 RepID=A0A1W0WYW6_HYPEX|nr:putative Secretin receptor [Hypsibius exemplaris]
MPDAVAENASRFCTENGTWFAKLINGQMKPWSNYTACNYTFTGNMGHQINPLTDQEYRLIAALPYLKALTVTGYSISLISLLAAITILLGFKRLYCPRNTLHINLFVSFIFRALAVILSRGNFRESESRNSVENQNLQENGVGCRIGIMVFQYAIMANYFWIFIEGCYLNSIMSFSVFTDHSKIWPHIVGGWAPPLLFVGIWAIVKGLTHNVQCWSTHTEDPGNFWILRGPITATIVMNFIFFLNIGRIIFIQFKNQTNLREQQTTKLKYRKMAKATLILLAVFGIHFFLLIFVAELSKDSLNTHVEIAWLVIDITVSSFQGLLAATLLCFTNGEVRNEVGRLVFRHRGALSVLRRNSSTHTHSTSRFRQSSEPNLRIDSIRMKTTTTTQQQRSRDSSIYNPMAKQAAHLKIPRIMNQASCESLYIANTAQNTAHNTAQNSDEELDDVDALPRTTQTLTTQTPTTQTLTTQTPTTQTPTTQTPTTSPSYMRQLSNTHTLVGSRSSNGEVHFNSSDK